MYCYVVIFNVAQLWAHESLQGCKVLEPGPCSVSLEGHICALCNGKNCMLIVYLAKVVVVA
jgi:hypothetical protein